MFAAESDANAKEKKAEDRKEDGGSEYGQASAFPPALSTLAPTTALAFAQLQALAQLKHEQNNPTPINSGASTSSSSTASSSSAATNSSGASAAMPPPPPRVPRKLHNKFVPLEPVCSLGNFALAFGLHHGTTKTFAGARATHTACGSKQIVVGGFVARPGKSYLAIVKDVKDDTGKWEEQPPSKLTVTTPSPASTRDDAALIPEWKDVQDHYKAKLAVKRTLALRNLALRQTNCLYNQIEMSCAVECEPDGRLSGGPRRVAAEAQDVAPKASSYAHATHTHSLAFDGSFSLLLVFVAAAKRKSSTSPKPKAKPKADAKPAAAAAAAATSPDDDDGDDRVQPEMQEEEEEDDAPPPPRRKKCRQSDGEVQPAVSRRSSTRSASSRSRPAAAAAAAAHVPFDARADELGAARRRVAELEQERAQLLAAANAANAHGTWLAPVHPSLVSAHHQSAAAGAADPYLPHAQGAAAGGAPHVPMHKYMPMPMPTAMAMQSPCPHHHHTQYAPAAAVSSGDSESDIAHLFAMQQLAAMAAATFHHFSHRR